MRVLKCLPTFFDVLEKDKHGNTHMDPLNRPDKALALEQHEKLFSLDDWFGITVESIDPVPRLVDMTFTANCGVMFEKGGEHCVLLSNFRPQRRRGEQIHYERFFTERGYRVKKLPRGVFFEGAGDALPLTNDTLLVGFGFRTSREAIPHISAITGKRVVALELKRPEKGEDILYHLDTAMTVFTGERPSVVIYPGAFTEEAYMTLLLEIMKHEGVLYEASYEDAINLALNAIVIPIAEIPLSRRTLLPKKCRGVVITADTASEELIEIFRKIGYHTVVTPLSEFIKSGGGAFCLTKILC